MKVAEILKRFMKKKGITYEELGGKLHQTKTNVWQILNGYRRGKGATLDRKDPNFSTVTAMCEAMGLKIKIEKKGDFNPDAVLSSGKVENVAYDTVKAILEAGGYELSIVDGDNFVSYKTSRNR